MTWPPYTTTNTPEQQQLHKAAAVCNMQPSRPTGSSAPATATTKGTAAQAASCSCMSPSPPFSNIKAVPRPHPQLIKPASDRGDTTQRHHTEASSSQLQLHAPLAPFQQHPACPPDCIPLFHTSSVLSSTLQKPHCCDAEP